VAGERATGTRSWISSAGAALFLLAVVVLGLAGLTLQQVDDPDSQPQSITPAAAPAPLPTQATPTATTAPTPTPTPTAPATPAAERSLLIIGDSFSSGVGASSPDKGWAPLVARAIEGPDLIDAVPASGYVFPGTARGADDSFPSRVQRLAAAGGGAPDVVIVQGGQEDYRGTLSELEQAVGLTVTRLRAAYPQARIVLFGSTRAFPESRALEPINAAITKAAAALDVPFIDPVGEQWINAGNSARYISYDLTHPDDAGYAYLTRRFLDDFRALPAG